ncbi:MAG: GFA family protein [Nannocystaceae bacterium]|nr:GFA family protein [Nannocystaceae bacterium]
MNVPSTTQGRCACGAVQYEFGGTPQVSLHCQCRKCQRISGTGHTSIFVVMAENLRLTGELTYFRQKTDTGSTSSNGFCPRCGSPVVNLTDRFPDSRYLHAATLDEPQHYAPTMTVFSEHAQPWDAVWVSGD